MDFIVSELKKFSNPIIYLGEPISDDRIEMFEAKYNLHIPDDFRTLIKLYNGISLMGMDVYGFDEGKTLSIEQVYFYEHFEVKVPQFQNLVPFSSDGSGNFYCLNTLAKPSQSCPVVFWMSNYYYSVEDMPEIVNPSFEDWIQNVLIGWTLEDYNYDGSLK